MVALRTSELLAGTADALRPPPELSLSEWADRFFYFSAESAAEPGRWKTLPYQRGIMDAITDPSVERITWMKSARVGATKCMNAAIGYYMHQDPCPILVVQPTVEDAQGYSKEEIAPMLRDCEVLSELVGESTAKVSEQTILHKTFPGGSLSMVGANSGRGFRRVSRRIVIFDEVDGYPPSAGAEGDQIKLGIRRTEYYWNRKIFAASTPLTAGASRIEEMFEAGDQRRYHVPCPHCGHVDVLTFHEQSERGHFMQWPDGNPEAAYFVCRAGGCVIEEQHKRSMLDAGEWKADAEFRGHASFHLWAAYSMSPNASWGQLAAEFVEAKRQGPEKLKTFVNTALGETWHDRGEAPDWERLSGRREPYPMASVPDGVVFMTAGVDVQKDRLEYEIVGWGLNKESWSIDRGALLGDTASEAPWVQFDALVNRPLPGASGEMHVRLWAVDSGYNTNEVYNRCRKHPMSKVIACKGMTTARTFISTASPVDVKVNGQRLQRGYKVWPINPDIGKAELYGWLRLSRPGPGEPVPEGYCHFPEYDDEYFKQLTAEHLVAIVKKSGFTRFEWQIIPGRQNHGLDCRILARAAASVVGLDRYVPPDAPPPAKKATKEAEPAEERSFLRKPERASREGRGGWLKGGRGGGWLGKRR